MWQLSCLDDLHQWLRNIRNLQIAFVGSAVLECDRQMHRMVDDISPFELPVLELFSLNGESPGVVFRIVSSGKT